ncbi:MAG: carboxymuconolactone decarboxylase family protein [Ancalomicrobiaceae bacterium]|nr:carboxymuconolactone decarboxylase family protein [Ancalomicrobiaceae bacterium]
MSEHAGMTYDSFCELAAPVRDALLALGKAVDAAGIDKALVELMKVRVSQLNGCAFCINMHLGLARKHGVSQLKLDLLPAWRETALYSSRERAALGWAEALTDLTSHRDVAAARAALFAEFSAHEATHVTSAIANISAWNRIVVGLGFPPAIEEARPAA